MSFYFTPLDIALPIGMGVVFGLFRYQSYRHAQLADATQRAALDAIKGIGGMAFITFAYKYFSNT